MSNHAPLVFEETSVLSEDISALLRSTVWGTPNHGARYRINSVDFFADFPTLNFHTLRDRQGHLVAVRYFHKHTLSAGPSRVNALYHSFSAVQPMLQGRGYGAELAARSRDAFLEKLGTEGGMIYAYVERDNQRNINNLKKAGYRVMGEFWTAAFTALHPSPCPYVRAAEPADVDALRRLYHAQYADSAFVDADESFRDSGYVVYEKDGKILAALHTKALHWSIERLGFPGDRLLLKLLAHVPGIRTVFPATNLRFLKMGNLCYQAGNPKVLRDLIDGTLAHFGYHSALAYVDKSTALTADLKKLGLRGWLTTLTETPIQILAHCANLPASALTDFSQRPKTFSPWNL